MRALTFDGPGRKSWTTVPDPKIQDPRDAIVRIDAVTICGTDLHILKGDVPEVSPGRVLGHEATPDHQAFFRTATAHCARSSNPWLTEPSRRPMTRP
jgi:hypothetical protein